MFKNISELTKEIEEFQFNMNVANKTIDLLKQNILDLQVINKQNSELLQSIQKSEKIITDKNAKLNKRINALTKLNISVLICCIIAIILIIV